MRGRFLLHRVESTKDYGHSLWMHNAVLWPSKQEFGISFYDGIQTMEEDQKVD